MVQKDGSKLFPAHAQVISSNQRFSQMASVAYKWSFIWHLNCGAIAPSVLYFANLARSKSRPSLTLPLPFTFCFLILSTAKFSLFSCFLVGSFFLCIQQILKCCKYDFEHVTAYQCKRGNHFRLVYTYFICTLVYIMDVIPNACIQESLNLYYCTSQDELFSIDRFSISI